jgi:hypothetical protein
MGQKILGETFDQGVAGMLVCRISRLDRVKIQEGDEVDNYGRVWHIDHVMPCCAFDLTRPEQVRVCFHFTNLQPMFARANLSKNRKITEPQLHLPL